MRTKLCFCCYHDGLGAHKANYSGFMPNEVIEGYFGSFCLKIDKW